MSNVSTSNILNAVGKITEWALDNHFHFIDDISHLPLCMFGKPYDEVATFNMLNSTLYLPKEQIVLNFCWNNSKKIKFSGTSISNGDKYTVIIQGHKKIRTLRGYHLTVRVWKNTRFRCYAWYGVSDVFMKHLVEPLEIENLSLLKYWNKNNYETFS